MLGFFRFDRRVLRSVVGIIMAAPPWAVPSGWLLWYSEYWGIFFITVRSVKCVSDASRTSILLSCRNCIRSSLWFASPLAFHSAMRRDLTSIVEFVIDDG